MLTVNIDDKKINVKEGTLLIEAMIKNDIYIPHFCYHEALGKDGNCRMCMVEIEGQKRPQIACDTPVKDGMIVTSRRMQTSRVLYGRRAL